MSECGILFMKVKEKNHGNTCFFSYNIYLEKEKEKDKDFFWLPYN